jgi:hypothetical protein
MLKLEKKKRDKVWERKYGNKEIVKKGYIVREIRDNDKEKEKEKEKIKN